MNISDEAVEAAAEALYENKYEHRAWDEAKSPDSWRDQARAALKAAASHLLAPVVDVADTLAASTLTGDPYLQGRASGFRIAAEHIRQAVRSES